ncbi:MAG: PDC sensor domain-containing protein, partial [Clostridia bacterium]|nr:PDC sensor domain-containing protein [Clostridia bacterium]
MKRWQNISIANKLILSVTTISLLSSLLLIGFFTSRVGSVIPEGVTKQLLATTEKYAIAFERNLDEVQKISDTIEDTFLRRIEGQPLNEETVDAVLNDMASIVEALAQNSTQGNTAYIYIDPEITGTTHDVYFADQEGDGIVERQTEIDKSYYATGPTATETKDWWFGPKESGEPYWTQPYIWYFDNGNAVNFVSYTKPLYYEGRFIGIVGSDLRYDDISYLIDNVISADQGYAYLIDKDEVLLSSLK